MKSDYQEWLNNTFKIVDKMEISDSDKDQIMRLIQCLNTENKEELEQKINNINDEFCK